MKRYGIWILILCAVSGCASMVRSEVLQFPAVWPDRLDRVLASGFSGDRKDPSAGASLAVEQVVVRSEATEPVSGQGRLTDEALTRFFVEQLRAHGVNAFASGGSKQQADYRLTPVFLQLAYTKRTGNYPGKVFYIAELKYQLEETDSGRVVWTRTLSRNHDRSLVLNMLSKLPDQELEHQEILLEHCVFPIVKNMAAGVEVFLEPRPEN